jgi:hypothetical protein
MKAHVLARLLLAGPNLEVSVGFDEESCEEYPEAILDGTMEGTPVSVTAVQGPVVQVVAVTIRAHDLDDDTYDDRSPLEAFQEDREDEIRDDIHEGRRDPSGRLYTED